MAWMNQEKKTAIAARLKTVVPAGWKYSLSVYNHSTIVMTISQAPVDIIGHAAGVSLERNPLDGWAVNQKELRTYWDVNPYHLNTQFKGGLLETFEKILAAMNEGNHDKSDMMTDYFDVGWYVSIKVGRYDKPFVCTAQPEIIYNTFNGTFITRDDDGEMVTGESPYDGVPWFDEILDFLYKPLEEAVAL